MFNKYMFNVWEEYAVSTEDILLWKFSTTIEMGNAIYSIEGKVLKSEENEISIMTKKLRRFRERIQ